MKRFSKLGAAIALIATTLIALAIGPVYAQADEGMVTFIHAVDGEDGFPADIYVNGELIFSSLRFLEGTQAVPYPAGDYEVDIFPAGDDPAASESILSAAMEVTGGANLSVVASVTEAGVPTITVYVNDTSPIPVGMVRLTLRHGAAAPSVDVMVDGAVAVADFTNGDDVTAVLASGGYSVSLVPTGGGEELFQADLDLSEGTGYVVYGVGSVDGGSFDAAVQVLGQFFQTPEGVPSGSGGLAGNDSSSLPLLAVGISLLLLGFVVAVRLRRREPTI